MDNDDIIKEALVETTKQVEKDVYNDAAQPAAKNVGGILGTITGFFNDVVLYPLKKLNIEYEQKALAFQREMEKKYNNIPEAQRVEPQLHIVGPAMEALKYNILEDDLAEMYSNLLISDMDSFTQKMCSVSFVKIIEQLSPNDAKLFKVLYHKNNCAICEIEFYRKDNDKLILKAEYIPQYFINVDVVDMDVIDISRSIYNLRRLGLIDISFTKHYTNEKIYESFTELSPVKNIIKRGSAITGNKYVPKIGETGVITITDFSEAFAKVCLRE